MGRAFQLLGWDMSEDGGSNLNCKLLQVPFFCFFKLKHIKYFMKIYNFQLIKFDLKCYMVIKLLLTSIFFFLYFFYLRDWATHDLDLRVHLIVLFKIDL